MTECGSVLERCLNETKDFDLAPGRALANSGSHQVRLATTRRRLDSARARFTSTNGGL